jgi:hypothetical protein
MSFENQNKNQKSVPDIIISFNLKFFIAMSRKQKLFS